MGYFDCCKGCVAPKRHVGCHSTCKEYLDDKAAYEDEKNTVKAEKNNRSTLGVKRKSGIFSDHYRQSNEKNH